MNIKIVLYFFLVTVTLSCQDNQTVDQFIQGEEPKSRKGDWIEEDKKLAKEYIKDAIRGDGSDPSEFPQTIDCVVRRLETHYENFEEAEFDEEGVAKIFSQCFLKEMKEVWKEQDSEDEGDSGY
jgi:hypothetical protein